MGTRLHHHLLVSQSLPGIFSASAQISFEALRVLQLDVADKANYSHPSTERPDHPFTNDACISITTSLVSALTSIEASYDDGLISSSCLLEPDPVHGASTIIILFTVRKNKLSITLPALPHNSCHCWRLDAQQSIYTPVRLRISRQVPFLAKIYKHRQWKVTDLKRKFSSVHIRLICS
jgi:hypothetical protein